MTEAVKATRKAAPKTNRSQGTEARETGLFAVFATGGKQYRVKVGDKVRVEKLDGGHKEGDKIIFDNVLMTDNGGTEVTLGTPFLKGSYVEASLNKIGRNKKVTVIKYKQKSRYFKKYGHRQPYFEVVIDNIK